jgi:hypothetical protein
MSTCSGFRVRDLGFFHPPRQPRMRLRGELVDRSRRAAAFSPTLPPAPRAGITAVAMDMWGPYVQSTRRHLPEAEDKIVFDKFALHQNV